MGKPKPPFIRRVKLRNYRSIKECDVALGPLALLVGPNGSGKSNFLDALRFVRDALSGTLEDAIRERGGMVSICRCGQLCPFRFAVELEISVSEAIDAQFGFSLASSAGPETVETTVEEEHCSVGNPDGVRIADYRVLSGKVESTGIEHLPPAAPDRLYLTLASSFPELRPLYELLRGMAFYDINPAEVAKSSPPNQIPVLKSNGEGAASVLRAIREEWTKRRVDDYLRAILPDFVYVAAESIEEQLRRLAPGSNFAVRTGVDLISPISPSFWLSRPGSGELFDAGSMSNGTLHALGVLLAVFQCGTPPMKKPIPLVGIEEPEATLHPGAAGVLFDALREASGFTQVIATTHSADLLDVKDLDPEALVVVEMVDGATVLGPADEASKSSIRDRLCTAGELLRENQLRPQVRPSAPIGADAEER